MSIFRPRLFRGYSTLAAVLAAWRKEQAAAVRPVIPEIPERVMRFTQHLWAEAWKAADLTHGPEREKFQRERAEQERLRAEMEQEIARLEAELSRVESERDSTQATLTKTREELERERVERAKAESTADAFQAELSELRVESRKTLDTVTAWVERATRAEARLEELTKDKNVAR